MPTRTTIPALLAFPVLAVLAASHAVAQDQPQFDARVEEQLGVKLPLPDRPVLARGRLV